MKHLSAITTVLLIGGITAGSFILDIASCVDWVQSERGVPVGNTTAFSGCSPAASISDQLARKSAILRAQANIARTKQLAVSGEEHLTTDQHGDTHYDMTVSESTGAFLHPVSVVNEEITKLDDVQYLCVLVVEK